MAEIIIQRFLRNILMAIFITSQTVNGTSKLMYLYTQFLSLNKVLLKFILYIIANITLAPSPVSAPLYTLANFTCEGIGDVLLWTVEDSSLGNPSNQQRYQLLLLAMYHLVYCHQY